LNEKDPCVEESMYYNTISIEFKISKAKLLGTHLKKNKTKISTKFRIIFNSGGMRNNWHAA
jgi:hypothetical protein